MFQRPKAGAQPVNSTLANSSGTANPPPPDHVYATLIGDDGLGVDMVDNPVYAASVVSEQPRPVASRLKEETASAPPAYADINRTASGQTYYSLSPTTLEIEAQQNPNAKFIYAMALCNGYQGCPVQARRGRKMIEELAAQAPLTAGGLCAQGKIFENGWGSSPIKDLNSALEKYNAAKNMGYIPGEYLFYSRPTYFNLGELTRIAAQRNYGPAICELSHLYYYGDKDKRIEQNIQEALKLAQQAANGHHDLYGRIIAGYGLYNYGNNKNKKANYAAAEKFLKDAKEQVTGGWEDAEKKLDKTLANLEYDEIPRCFRCLMEQWCGCWCAASLCYPVAPSRVLGGDQWSTCQKIAFFPAFAWLGFMGPCLNVTPAGACNEIASPVNDSSRRAPGTGGL